MQRDLAALLIERDIIFAEYQITIEDSPSQKRVMPGGNFVLFE